MKYKEQEQDKGSLNKDNKKSDKKIKSSIEDLITTHSSSKVCNRRSFGFNYEDNYCCLIILVVGLYMQYVSRPAYTQFSCKEQHQKNLKRRNFIQFARRVTGINFGSYALTGKIRKQTNLKDINITSKNY